jgi:hypothetical protein
MLNSIFNKFSNKTKSDNNKTKEETTEDFLNEQVNLSMKNKCDEVIKRYCSLYNDDESKDEKYSIKPLSYKYSEKKNRRLENANTTGPGWFNMKAPEMTPELKEDLKAVQLRHIIDPARFYKKMDRDNLPKYFQVGTILDNIIEGKKNRLKKNEVKSRLAEEFLESDVAKNYSLRKFEELQGEKRKIGLKKTKLNKYKLQSKKKSKKSEMIVK